MEKLRSVLLFWGCVLIGISVGSALNWLLIFGPGDTNGTDPIPTVIQQVTQFPNGWYLLILSQDIGHLFSYLIPALFFWYYFENSQWNDFNRKPLRAVSALWIGLLGVIAIFPFNELIIDWNQRLELPELLGPVEDWMRYKEQQNELLTNQLIRFDSADQFIIALAVIGFIASLGEEVFFRGIVQRKLVEWMRNAHAGIWLAAVLFSAMHFQFFGFFPRLVLGVVFGYLYLWSGNIWVPTMAHFLNNGLIVAIIYLQQQPMYAGIELTVDIKSWLWVFISGFGSISLLLIFYKANLKSLNKGLLGQ
ncbi:CPBP family intramembrane glutamic endopeptidase [Telluribacter sp. SYSU D00476]|uniref:CPBP family intramembrane glutamic endopeptidase n=1 Tax=Telluribacter sp. SYSU D00476 TaxID=2811430 RepID=UPI001FF22100|nr:CPBP family intramembrane glutamic endopeptidase [Telluribacter sp. SYSU D00476]